MSRVRAVVLLSLAGAIAFGGTSFFLYGSRTADFHIIPDGHDRDLAVLVGHFIERSYGKFDDRRKAESPAGGKTYYTLESASGNPEVTLYEVTSQEDMESIESAAREALKGIPEIHSVTLLFYEKQNINWSGGVRGYERLLKRERITRGE